ncbi:hypothetical protein MB901379_01693 [Mycobacterium basiliense]|uniref:Uncharacterized protein n=1 Tax=Mycobacterium basiliense TaxID=2094119 RepID=A0A447GCD0_9MYCO|nr:hypothetical protein [Mycobacterium basiliense]VDM88137.1 hypothetical protein MB901379_01693 [Mycobacterium basiliense]
MAPVAAQVGVLAGITGCGGALLPDVRRYRAGSRIDADGSCVAHACWIEIGAANRLHRSDIGRGIARSSMGGFGETIANLRIS